jgi:hypothetical protein
MLGSGTHYPLKGMILGNGVTDLNFDFFCKNTPPTYTAYNIFPERLLDDFENKNCTIKNPFVYPDWEPTAECAPIVKEMQLLHNTHVNIYDLLHMPAFSIVKAEQ